MCMSSRGHSCRCCADESHQSVFCFIRARMRVSMSLSSCVWARWRAHLYCIREHLCVSVHLLASTSKSERVCFLVLLWRVCTPCPAVWVRKWPAAVHEAYLWVKLAKIHLIKCAFYSVSHKQIPTGSVHSPTTQQHPQISPQHLLTCSDYYFFFSEPAEVHVGQRFKVWVCSKVCLTANSPSVSRAQTHLTPTHYFVKGCVLSQTLYTQTQTHTHTFSDAHASPETGLDLSPTHSAGLVRLWYAWPFSFVFSLFLSKTGCM